ncbi:hypothetical protein M378DRAFT_344234 [Amanita muscaria Koide BX008]|uniref:Uncharacterized protein n=1 Tax=Amanita muscaria (strain Koide BX008) TaxID=946122 RepID=A0A0C2S5S9_AMAMK|nr:hypothetical protein M378DRAFT_344234 [Amanita muscaria Koide BX008]
MRPGYHVPSAASFRQSCLHYPHRYRYFLISWAHDHLIEMLNVSVPLNSSFGPTDRYLHVLGLRICLMDICMTGINVWLLSDLVLFKADSYL